MLHLTSTSSAYIKNLSGWTADHNLDGGTCYTVTSTGRGILVEATKGTWLTGSGPEHNWLYNNNFHSAQNVYAGILQKRDSVHAGQRCHAGCPGTLDSRVALRRP
jgi:glucan 1,3-beta-glucosidase